MSDRKINGQFKKGCSGNLKGRPSSESTKIRQQLSCNSNELIEVIMKAAIGGDMQACKIIMDRICPPLKAQAAPVAIKLPRKANMMKIAELLIKEAAIGSIPPDVAAQMMSAVGQLAQVAKINDGLPKPEETNIINSIELRLIDREGNVKILKKPHNEENS